jgi:carnitine 3-dehydrogenase
MGPTLLFHLGAGEGGLGAFCERYADSFNRWWDDLGRPYLDGETADRLVQGLAPTTATQSVGDLTARRDDLTTALVAASQRV